MAGLPTHLVQELNVCTGILLHIGISKEHNLYIPLPSRLMALYISLGKLI